MDLPYYINQAAAFDAACCWFLLILTTLIAYGARSLASGLAGSLALTTATLLNSFLKVLLIQSLYVFHNIVSYISYYRALNRDHIDVL